MNKFEFIAVNSVWDVYNHISTSNFFFLSHLFLSQLKLKVLAKEIANEIISFNKPIYLFILFS